MLEAPTSTEEIHICSLSDLKGDAYAQALSNIEKIFFATSSRTEFSSPEQKENFYSNYTSYYVNHCPDWFYLAIKSNQVVGYLTGCPYSELAKPHLEQLIPTSALFTNCFQAYPAHLHINVDPSVQGQGLGAKLINHFTNQLKQADSTGVHLVTAASARNVSFYTKLGFQKIDQGTYRDTELVCLGLSLKDS